MAGRVNWEANVSSNVREILEYTDKLRGELEKLENGNYGIKLNIDEKRLASVISNLDKMLSSLGKGSGDFKQFENLSKELSGIISEVQNLSKAFGKVQDSGTKTLLSSIQNIDKSLSELSQHIINVNKNMGNIGGDTNGTVKQVENISNAYDNAAKSAEKLADAQSKIGNKSNISSGTQIKDVFQGDDKVNTDASTTAIKEESQALEQVSTSAKEAATSKEKFANANKEVKASADETVISVDKEISALEKAGNRFESQAFNLSIKPDEQHQFSSWVNKLKELNLKIDEYSSKVKYLKENNITDEEQIKEVEKLRDSIDETIKTMSKTPQANRGWTQLSIDKTIQKMNDDLKENSGYSKETKRNIQALIEELKNIPDRPLSEILNDFYRFKREAHDAGREGKSFFAILKDKTIYGYAAQLASTYLSFTDMVRYVGQGIDAINEFDTGLTKISYTMDMTKSQLDDLGNSVLNMASDMKTSIDDAMSVAQIYANMNTSAEEIKKLSEPTLILSNLSGFDSATIADDIQAVTQQFEMAADESMHIADVYDYISRNIAVDYSKFWSLYWKQYNENKSKSVKTKLFYN